MDDNGPISRKRANTCLRLGVMCSACSDSNALNSICTKRSSSRACERTRSQRTDILHNN